MNNDEHKDSTGTSQTLAIARSGMILVNLAATLTNAGPAILIAAAGLELSMDALQLVRERLSAKAEKTVKRLVRAEARVEEIVGTATLQPNEEQQDKFVEVIEALIDDDETDKDIVYAGVLGWIAKENPRRAKVRVLADAVRSLSYVELYVFLQEAAGRQVADHVANQEGIEAELRRSRLKQYGLHVQGVPFHGVHTPLAQVLIDYIPVNRLAPPNEATRRQEAEWSRTDKRHR